MPAVPSTPKVIVVTGALSDSFMRDDLRIIHGFAEAIPHELLSTPAPGGRVIGRFTRLVLNVALLVYRLVKHDVRALLFWFVPSTYGPLMTRIAKLFGVRVIAITGGQDSVYVPEIDWGDMKSPRHRRAFGWMMRQADAVLPFSDSARRTIVEQFEPRYIRTIYPSVDARFFRAAPGAARAARVVTCCYQYGAGNIVQKGLDQFIAAGREAPEIEFVVVGTALDDAARQLAAGAPANVRFVARIPGRAGYRDFLAGSAAYAQLSVHEGFGVSLAEAMACGCVPVVADRYSLPEVAGDAGFVVPYGDVAATVRAIRCAVRADEPRRQAAADRVARLFPREERRRLLYEEFTRLVPDLANAPLRIELGCGSTGVPGAIGVDLRQTVQTSAVCDVQHSCFRSGIADEVYSFCVLEHLDDPYKLMDEVVRVLKPGGRAYLRVPNIGTFSSHLDTTHRFLADLRIWRGIMNGYFEQVTVVPEGTKYRDSRLLTAINWTLVHGLRFHELTQGWTFVCDRKRATPRRGYVGWWQESGADR